MRILACGGQRYAEGPKVFEVLDGILIEHEVELLVHGGCPGADALASRWAMSRDVQQVICRGWADCERDACVGTVEQMLDVLRRGKDRLVVAFPGGLGTSVIVGAARSAGIRTVEIGAFEEEYGRYVCEASPTALMERTSKSSSRLTWSADMTRAEAELRS